MLTDHGECVKVSVILQLLESCFCTACPERVPDRTAGAQVESGVEIRFGCWMITA